MGKFYTAVLADGSERFAAHFSMGRASVFYELALHLERIIGVPCGIGPDNGEDEHRIDAALFIHFFEAVQSQGWLTEVEEGFFSVWASYAAGMIENMTLRPRTWLDRRGTILPVKRYLRPDEISSS